MCPCRGGGGGMCVKEGERVNSNAHVLSII